MLAGIRWLLARPAGVSLALSAAGLLAGLIAYLDSFAATAYLVGLVLQLAGFVMAMRGLADLSQELFGRKLPHEAAFSWMKRILRRQRKGDIVVGVATIELPSLMGQARGYSTRPRPSDAAPGSVWFEYWDSRFAALQTQLGWLKEDMREADNELRQLVGDEAATRSAEDARLETRFQTVIGGFDGQGLVETWWGLVAAAVGTVLTTVVGWPG